MLGANITVYFSENLIGIITSKFLGKELMGLFNIAYNLAIIPSTKIKNVFVSVLIPGFAKIQGDLKSFYRNNIRALNLMTMLFVPSMFILSSVSDELIKSVYGIKWEEAGKMLALLSFVGLLKGIQNLIQSSILAKGHAHIIFYSKIINIAISIPLMYFLIHSYQIYGLIISYILGTIVGFIYVAHFFNKMMGDKFLILKSLYKPLIISLAIVILNHLVGLLPFSVLTILILKLLFLS